MPPKKKDNIERKNKKKKNLVEQKTEWDELDIDTLQKTVRTMQERLGEVQKQRFFAEAECDTMQHFYENTLQSIDETEVKIKLKELELDQLKHEYDMELRSYQDKVAFLRQERMLVLKDMRREETNQLVKLQCEMDAQLLDLREAKKLLENENNQIELIYNTDLHKLKENIKQEFEADQGELNRALQSLKQTLRETKDDLNQDLLLQLIVEKHDTCESKNTFLNEIARRQEERKQQMILYYNGITKDQMDKIAAMRARIDALKKKRDSDIETAQKMKIETCMLEGPLVEVKEEVLLLKARFKKRERNINALNATKKRIAVVKKKIAVLQRECSNLHKSCTHVESEHENLKIGYDRTKQEANQSSTRKAEILGKKIDVLSRAVATDEEQLYRVLNAASLSEGEPESISAMLREVLEQKNEQINLLRLMVAKASKDNAEFLIESRNRLSNAGYSIADVSCILDNFSV